MSELAVIIAVIIAVIWGLVVFPTFRIVVVVLALAGAGLMWVEFSLEEQAKGKKNIGDVQARLKFEMEKKKFWENEDTRWSMVSPSQIEVRDALMTPSFGGEFSITASVKNKAGTDISGVSLQIIAYDCPQQGARLTGCDIVGRTEETFYSGVPAGEVRQISRQIRLENMPKPRGVLSWKFDIKGVRAPIDASDKTGLIELYLYSDRR